MLIGGTKDQRALERAKNLTLDCSGRLQCQNTQSLERTNNISNPQRIILEITEGLFVCVALGVVEEAFAEVGEVVDVARGRSPRRLAF